MDEIPNWLKPLPGLLILGVSFVALLSGWVWPWGWAIGVVLLCVGILTIKKDDGYNI